LIRTVRTAVRASRQQAAVLLVLAWVLTLHQWVPALFVCTFVAWVILHKRLEGDLGHRLTRWWRRAWPPASLALIPLLAASTLVFWDSGATTTAKVLPIALNLLGLSMILFAGGLPLFRRTTSALRNAAGGEGKPRLGDAGTRWIRTRSRG
jgi:hypothetical protein